MIDVYNINSNSTNSNFEYLKLCDYNEKICENLIPSDLVKKSLKENKV